MYSDPNARMDTTTKQIFRLIWFTSGKLSVNYAHEKRVEQKNLNCLLWNTIHTCDVISILPGTFLVYCIWQYFLKLYLIVFPGISYDMHYAISD